MKRLAWLTAAVALGALATAADLWAAEQPGKLGGGKIVVRASEGSGGLVVFSAGGVGKTPAAWYIESIDKIVKLTDAQKHRITEIIEARDKAMKDFQAQNAEKTQAAGKAFTEAYKSKNKEAIAKAQKDYQALYAPMHEIMKKSQADLAGVLTVQQQAALRESRLMTMIKYATDPVKLSPEQIKKIKAAMPKAAGSESAERKSYEAIQQVLTPEQKATIVKHRATGYVKSMFFQAKLTPDQWKQVEAAYDQMIKDGTIKAAGGWEGYEKLADKVNGLLTAEQKEAMKKARTWSPAGGGAVRFAPGAPVPGSKKPLEKKGETPRGVKVTQLPGGGVQITISEQGEARERSPKQREEARKAAKARMREKVKRQKDLAEQAWQTFQKMDALGEGKPHEAHELWEKLERIEGDLRRTFEAPATMALPPGFPGAVRFHTGAAMPGASIAGPGNREAIARRLKELSEKIQQLSKQGKAEEAKRLKHEAAELHETLERLSKAPRWQLLERPGRPLVLPLEAGRDPAIRELRAQVKELRRQVEEIKAALKKGHEPKKK